MRVTPRRPAKLRQRASRRRDGIYLVDFTQAARRARDSVDSERRCAGKCTMHNANTVYVFLAKRGWSAGRGRRRGKGAAIATADNGGSGQKNNRCFRAYGIARRILRTILALWCKCRGADAAWESFKNLWAVNRAPDTIEASRRWQGNLQIEGGKRVTRSPTFIVISCSTLHIFRSLLFLLT